MRITGKCMVVIQDGINLSVHAFSKTLLCEAALFSSHISTRCLSDNFSYWPKSAPFANG